jgi:hypothetical protein
MCSVNARYPGAGRLGRRSELGPFRLNLIAGHSLVASTLLTDSTVLPSPLQLRGYQSRNSVCGYHCQLRRENYDGKWAKNLMNL